MNGELAIAIADDHVLFASGIRMLIDAQPDLTFVGAAHDGREAVEFCRSHRVDVMLMDVRMPRLDGISAIRQIVALSGHMPRVIVLTTHQNDSAVEAAIAAGAHGFLMKDSSPELLLSAIRSVASGRNVIMRPGDTREFRDFTPSDAERAARSNELLGALSPRERELFAYAAEGLTIAEMAQTAHLSESTVKTHISSILGKLGLASRLQLVAFAHRHGIAP